jgi:transposase
LPRCHAVAEVLERPTTRFVPAKTDKQLDLQALHRVRSRLISERIAVINQMRGFLLERGIIVRQGLRFLRQVLPDILAKRTDVLSPRMVRIVADLASDWRQLDERIENVTDEIEALAKSDDSCRRVMTVPGIGPIISSAMVAAIGSGPAFARGRDFSAWLGLVPKQMSTGDRLRESPSRFLPFGICSSLSTISDSALQQSRSIRTPLRAILQRPGFQYCLDGI